MKLLFAHDSDFYRTPDGDVVTNSQFRYPILRRYLDVFPDVAVAGIFAELPRDRVVHEFLEPASGPGLQFVRTRRPRGLEVLSPIKQRFGSGLAEAVSACDAVIARLPSFMGFMALDAARAQRKPWAVELVACPHDVFRHHGTLAGRIVMPYAVVKTRRLLAAAPFALYVTEHFLQGRYPTRGETTSVSNVEVARQPQPVLDARLARVRARLPDQKLVFGSIASLVVHYKGADTLIDAMASAGRRLGPVELRILGYGDPAPWRRRAEASGVGDLVTFSAPLPGGPAVLAWLNDLDLYLQPSRQEGLPRALIEAMSQGLPALGSTAGGIPELLDPGDLFAPGDAAALARLIMARARDTAWAAARSERNFAMAQRYGADILDERRRRFWMKFAEYARAKGARNGI